MCSSLESLNVETFALGLRLRARLISYPDFPLYVVSLSTLSGVCSDGNRFHLENWPFCHMFTYSLGIIGTYRVLKVFLESGQQFCQ